MVVICISLTTDSIEHLFICLMTSCMSSLKNYPFISSAHFSGGSFVLFDIELNERFIYFGY